MTIVKKMCVKPISFHDGHLVTNISKILNHAAFSSPLSLDIKQMYDTIICRFETNVFLSPHFVLWTTHDSN